MTKITVFVCIMTEYVMLILYFLAYVRFYLVSQYCLFLFFYLFSLNYSILIFCAFSLFLPSYKSNPYYRYFRKYTAVHRGRTLPITQWSKMTNIRICVSFCFSFFFFLKILMYLSIYSGSTTY